MTSFCHDSLLHDGFRRGPWTLRVGVRAAGRRPDVSARASKRNGEGGPDKHHGHSERFCRRATRRTRRTRRATRRARPVSSPESFDFGLHPSPDSPSPFRRQVLQALPNHQRTGLFVPGNLVSG